jgi:hypothetical protein
MADRITEVLEDGTIYCFDMDKCIQEANDALEKLYEKEGVELDFDFTATVFSLFVNCIHILTESGWTTNDLISEVIDHSTEDIDEEE